MISHEDLLELQAANPDIEFKPGGADTLILIYGEKRKKVHIVPSVEPAVARQMLETEITNLKSPE